MLKVGILGAGGIGVVHANAYRRLPDKAKVIAVADRRTEKAAALAHDLGAETYSNAEDLLSRDDIDIVDICLPTFLHEEYVVKAARLGKHILCEKPMALSLSSADNMIAATKEKNVKFMVAQCLRFWPEYVAVRERLSKGDLGRIKVMTAARVSPLPGWSWNDWMTVPELSGGALIDLHIHDVDFANSLVRAQPLTVMAVGSKSRKGSVDHVDTLITYESGERAAIEADWLVPKGYPFTTFFRVICENGAVELLSKAGSQDSPRVTVYSGDSAPEMLQVTSEKDAYTAEVEYFLDCVEQDMFPAVVPPEDSRMSLAVTLAAMESVKTGEAVDLRDIK